MPKIRYSASNKKNKAGGALFSKKIIMAPVGTIITNPFSGNWAGQNVGSSFQMVPQNAPSWAGVITGRRVSPPPQTVTVSGVTGVNAAAANGTYKMYYDGFGNYWFEDKNFTGTNYSQVSTWLPNATITAY